MNKDKVKGAMDDAIGRVKRQSGEWTGDVDKQVEGAGQQVKGKAEKVWGNIKDAAHNPSSHNRDEKDRNTSSTAEQHSQRER
jgi:uncharacterized protein YjbJ (UPF0337 family)